MRKGIWIGIVILLLGGSLLLLQNSGFLGDLKIQYLLWPLGIVIALWLIWIGYLVLIRRQEQRRARDAILNHPFMDDLQDYMLASIMRKERPCPYCGGNMKRDLIGQHFVCNGSGLRRHGEIRCHVIERGCFETSDSKIVAHFKQKGYTMHEIVQGAFEIFNPSV